LFLHYSLAPVGMETRARSTASGIARLQARAPVTGRVQPGTCLSQAIAEATGSVATIPTNPLETLRGASPLGYTKFNQPTLSLPWRQNRFFRPDGRVVYRRSRQYRGAGTADTQARVIALEDETTSLRMVINHLEAENAHCSEELAIVRLAIRELETLILLPIAMDGEYQKKKVQSIRKSSSSRGDSPNSRKNKLRKKASDSSSEGDTSEEDDVHTHVGL
jgi:hypothetical protein